MDLNQDSTDLLNKPRPTGFFGFIAPFRRDPGSGQWTDANGSQVPEDIGWQWAAKVAAENGPSSIADFSGFDLSGVGGGFTPGASGDTSALGGGNLGFPPGIDWSFPPGSINPWPVPPPQGAPNGNGSVPGQMVSAADMKLALDQYREAIAKSNTQYAGIMGHTPAPTPASVVSPVQATANPNRAQMASPAQRLQTALQGQTTVGATGFNGTQADQSRALALQNVQDLQATAAGAGAGQQAAAARLKLALQRSSEVASGRAAQARGAERRGLRREAMLEGGRRALEGATALEAQAAQERQTAQGQLGQQLQATRSTDVDVAAKQAQLDQERKTLQAQLDAARAANNADAVNAINTKMADLEARRQEFNATARNQAQARAEDQGFSAQNLNNQTGLEVSRLTEEQRVANERLKLDASKASQDAAQGLLTENARQEQLAFAREQLRQAKDQADRQFWGNIITSLLSGASAVGAAAIKPATSDVRAKTDIAPVRDKDLGDLARAVRDSLATWKYKRAEDGPAGERAGPMAQDLERTRLGRAVTSEREDGTKQVDYAQLATLLAAATVKSRKRAEAN